MDLASRKLALISTCLSLKDSRIMDGLEIQLNQKLATYRVKDVQPMSLEKFHKEIEQSIEDSENDNGVEANVLLEEIKNWK